jgi:thioester reductase-like protein
VSTPEVVPATTGDSMPSLATTLERDARLADDLAPTERADDGSPTDVLLTGATGFVGAELARALLATTPARIRCLVRGSKELSARERWAGICRRVDADPARITLVEGDLESGALGDRELANSVDCVVHCAASVNLFAPYAALRATNTLGPRAVLAFAARGRPKAVHFVSTAGIFLSPHYRRATVFEDQPVEGQEGLSNGYAQSKWVADTMMARARTRGFDVTRYRPAFVGWHSSTGRAGEHDLVALLLRASLAAECAPNLDLQVNSTPVDHVGATVARVVARTEARGGTYHVVNRRAVPFVELAELADLPVADFSVWRAAVTARAPQFTKFAATVHAAEQDETSGSAELRRQFDRTYDDSSLKRALGADYTPTPEMDAAYVALLCRAVRP